MAHHRDSELLDYKAKYEESERQLGELKNLSHKAVADYEELKRKYDENQKKYEELRTRLENTDYQLKQLQQALEPACEEYKELQDLYTVENKCREEAEKYATTVVEENKKLKRQSQQLLDHFNAVGTFDLANLKFDTIEEDADLSEGQVEQLKTKIETLEATLNSTRERCHQLEEERVKLCETELIQNRNLEQCKNAVTAAQNEVSELQKVIDNYNTVTEQAVKEHKELVKKYEEEKALRIEAEKYASEMLSQKHAVVRQSTVVLSAAMSDDKLRGAFSQIEELEKLLEAERQEHAQKIRELEDKLAEGNAAKLQELEQRLEIVMNESQAKTEKLKEMESWKAKLEKDCKDLTLKLDAAEERIRAPPPPPPPPPLPTSLFRLFRPAMKKSVQKKTCENVIQNRVPTFDKTLQEMMTRIKSGNTLRAVPQQRRPEAAAHASEPKTSAMDEMNKILQSLKVKRSQSVDEGRKNLMNEGQSEYEKIFSKIKGGTIGPTTGGAIASTNLARISEEKDGDLNITPGKKTTASDVSKDRPNL